MEWRKTDPEHSYCRIEGMDPCADWVLGPGFEDFSRDARDKVLIPCTIGPLDTDMVEIMKSIHEAGAASGVFIPSAYHGAKEGKHIVGFVKKAVFDQLAENGGPFAKVRGSAKHIDLSLPLDRKSLPEHWKSEAPAQRPADPPVGPPGKRWPKGTVVIGIVDDGIAFAHERFRLRDGSTRVQCFWRQDGVFDNDGSTVDFGSEICKPGIDDLLQRHERAGLVDEEALYREAGLIDFRDRDHKAAAWRLSHGTHVLDLAAGYRSACAPDNRPIIAVQLPVSVTADTSGSNLKAFATAAIQYILDRADRLAGDGPQLPVVINFSYGMLAGPHDGTLDLEQAMDEFIDRRKNLRIVLPAGNANLSRCHAEIGFTEPGATKTLQWRVQPDDQTPTHMEIWLPHAGPKPPDASRVSIRVETPSGLCSEYHLPETPGAGLELVSDGEVIALAQYAFRPSPTERGVFVVCLKPTARLGPPDTPASARATAPAGAWKIHITNSADAGLSPEQKLNAWIQWDDVIYGYSRRGRQSYFEDDCYRRFDAVTGDLVDVDDPDSPCLIKRSGLINAIATGHKTIVVGALQQKDLGPPKYSAGGPATPTRDERPHRTGPDALSVSDDSRVHRGIPAAGSRSGSRVLMGGTSVATPQIASLVADMLAEGKEGNREAISRFASAEERMRANRLETVGDQGDQSTEPRPSKERGGSGRIVRPRPDWTDRYDTDA